MMLQRFMTIHVRQVCAVSSQRKSRLTDLPWRNAGRLVLVAIVTSVAEENGDALVVVGIQAVNLLLGEK